MMYEETSDNTRWDIPNSNRIVITKSNVVG